MTDQPYSYGTPPEVVRGEAPPPVRTAVTLMLVRAALSLLGPLFLLADKGALRDSLRGTTAAGDVDTAVNAAVTLAIVFGLVFVVLYVLLALQVKKGKSWARIVTLVLAALGILFGLVGLAATAPAVSHVLGVVGLAFDIAIVVLLSRGQSSAYFAS